MHSSYDPIQKNSSYLLLGIKKATKKIALAIHCYGGDMWT